jgi:mannose-6-phosphate isomerase-like protein (cupin superfamily)
MPAGSRHQGRTSSHWPRRVLGPWSGTRPTGIVAGMDVTTADRTILMTADAIAALPLEPLGRLEGVRHRVLWSDDTSMAGVLTVAAGHQLGVHAHRRHHHHLWVLDGEASIKGEQLGPGAYAHIPSGVQHDIDATDTDGCTVFYLYVRYGN